LVKNGPQTSVVVVSAEVKLGEAFTRLELPAGLLSAFLSSFGYVKPTLLRGKGRTAGDDWSLGAEATNLELGFVPGFGHRSGQGAIFDD
jgi:hypothetical protein